MPKIGLLVVCFSFCIGGPVEQIRAEVLIHNGGKATWSFKDDGKQPGANWDKPGFDDSQWRRGSGPFGYGEDGVATEVLSGEGDEPVTTTTFFRTTFDVRAPREFTQLLLTVRADDDRLRDYLQYARSLIAWVATPTRR